MKIYVSGPMTGRPHFNQFAFNRAAQQLRSIGYDVSNPVDCGLPPGSAWLEYMRADITMLLRCDAVATLDEWWLSRGARIEVHLAACLDMPVRPLAEWLAEPRLREVDA